MPQKPTNTSLPAGIAILADGLTCQISDHFHLGPLSFSVEEASSFAIVGPDGAGKSSLVQILAALRRPDRGELLGCGPAAPRSERQSLGYVSQHFSLYLDLSVYENLLFVADLFSLPIPKQAVDTLLQFSGLETFASRRAGALSGGMKQKLSLAAALLHNPKIVLLDEPTTGLDPVARSELWELLRTLVAKGTTVIYATSVLQEAEQAHTVMMMHQGKRLAIGAPNFLKENSGLKHALIEVKEPRKVLSELKEKEKNLYVNLQNNGISLAVPPEWDHSRLELYGIRAETVSWSLPTCEELFLHLISHSEKEEKALHD